MNDIPRDKQQYPPSGCKDCVFLRVLYQLEEEQYQFGCDNQLTCKYIEEEEKNV